MKKTVLICFLSISFLAKGQSEHWKTIFSAEEKISIANANFSGFSESRNILRYNSGLTNFYFKNHFKFNNKRALSLNIGLSNYGHIFHLNDSIRLKQRMYAIPVGLQFTFGKLNDKNFFVGGEALIPFHYKQKTWQEGRGKDKIKSNEWFGKQAEITPVVFIGFQYSEEAYIKFSYQLSSFINPNYNFNIRGINSWVSSNNLLELTFGTTFKNGGGTKFKPLDDSKDLDIQI